MKVKKWPLLFCIPLLSLAIIFFLYWTEATSDFSFFLQKFLITLFVTTTVWMVDAKIFETFALKYPDFKHTKLRLFYTITGFVVATFVVYTTDCYLICTIVFKKPFWYNYVENIKITFVVTIIVYVIYECIFFFHNWEREIKMSEQLKKEHIISQYESLKNQINPHFLFNSLNTLSAIIPQDADKAVDFVQQLSASYRYLLKMKEKELVTVDDEFEFVESYLFLIKTRYGSNIDIVLERTISETNLWLPPVSLQMLVENCIKHNVISKDKPLKIVISITNKNIVVTNNLQPKQQKEICTGLGLENIKKRYSLYSDCEVVIKQTDTHFEVTLPLIQLEQ